MWSYLSQPHLIDEFYYCRWKDWRQKWWSHWVIMGMCLRNSRWVCFLIISMIVLKFLPVDPLQKHQVVMTWCSQTFILVLVWEPVFTFLLFFFPFTAMVYLEFCTMQSANKQCFLLSLYKLRTNPCDWHLYNVVVFKASLSLSHSLRRTWDCLWH